jgi:hypothetical protein
MYIFPRDRDNKFALPTLPKEMPSQAELKRARKRWERDHGLTSEIVQLYIHRVQQIYLERSHRFITGELIIALLWHFETAGPEYFRDAVEWAHRLSSPRRSPAG